MKENYGSYLKNFRSDLPSGLVVFLVALPLCLGIALASGAPLFSGIITGIVGGIVVGLLSGSHLSVSGPAAGLTVIVLGAITELGAFETFLLAVVLAGVIQLTMGYLKAGIIGLYFPSSVIKGMLAAIGLILILKQIPHFLGVDQEAFGATAYGDGEGHNTFTNFFSALQHIQPGALLVGVISLFLLILWERPFIKKQTWARLLPGALIAVVLSVVINAILSTLMPTWSIENSHLVNLPILGSEGAENLLTLPNFEAITNPLVWKTALVIAIIASLETLLSVEAVDKMDPHKRRTPNNRELKAQGIGNIIAGLVGGLPMTAVIVRSTANLESGARTKMSAVYHGIFLVAAVLLIPSILNMIPLSALAAILLMVGYKLAKPKLLVQQYKNGWDQFIPFVITIVAILFTDLLIGITIGMMVGIFFILKANYKTPYFYHDEEHPERDGHKQITIMLSEHVSFINKASLQLTLEHLPTNSNVVIDGSRSQDIDFDALNIIEDFVNTAHERNIQITIKNMPKVITSAANPVTIEGSLN